LIAPARGFEHWELPPDEPIPKVPPVAGPPSSPVDRVRDPDSPSVARLVALAAAILLIAIAARLPVIGESFWVDELHSAWSVWGGLSDVRERAAMGNQTPIAYWGFWFWRQLVGDGEAALRMSSVLLSSAAAAIVAVGVARCGRTILGGAVAGLMLAMEANAVFFGTEFRAYAAILPLAAIACWAWVRSRRVVSRFATGGSRLGGGMFVTVFLAAIIQPMSLGVLIWPLVDWCWTRRDGFRSRRIRTGGWMAPLTVAVIAVVGALGAWLFWEFAGRVWWEAWRNREQWKGFGSAHSPWQWFTVWPWTWMLILPVGLAWLAERIAGRTGEADFCGVRMWGPPAAVALGATLLFWFVSATGIAAVFHRRYLIAALPLIAWSGGAAVGHASRVLASLGRDGRDGRDGRESAGGGTLFGRDREFWLIALLLVAGMLAIRPLFFSGSAIFSGPGAVAGSGPFGKSRNPLRLRGEDWRGAVRWVGERRSGGDPVWLSPGLIEAERRLVSGEPADLEYLAYPLSGPYRLEPVEVISLRRERVAELPTPPLDPGQAWCAVLRTSSGSARRWADEFVRRYKGRVAYESESFGGVQAIRFETVTVASP